MEFKRGKNVNQTLKIGGLIPENIFKEVESEAWDKWKKFQNSLIGKNIHFIGLKRNPNKLDHHTFLRVEKDILVKDTKSIAFYSEFNVQDNEDDQWYTITPKEKIYII